MPNRTELNELYLDAHVLKQVTEERDELKVKLEEIQEQEAVAWRWAEINSSGKEHWFSWTSDWDHYQRAIDLGCKIEYAVPIVKEKLE